MNPRIIDVRANDNYTLDVTFDNGEIRVFDVQPYLGIGIFKSLKDIGEFKTVKASLGTVVWEKGQDFCPDMVYLESQAVAEPEEVVI